jgi:hypothetical protein
LDQLADIVAAMWRAADDVIWNGSQWTTFAFTSCSSPRRSSRTVNRFGKPARRVRAYFRRAARVHSSRFELPAEQQQLLDTLRTRDFSIVQRSLPIKFNPTSTLIVTAKGKRSEANSRGQQAIVFVD